MADSEPGPSATDRKANRRRRSEPPAQLDLPEGRPTPTDRLEAMTRDRIAWLEAEVDRQRSALEAVRAVNDRLAPENAALRVHLREAQASNLVSNILIVLGGGLLGYSAFAGSVSHVIAALGGGLMLGGIVLLLSGSIRRAADL